MTFVGIAGSIADNGTVTPPAGAQAGDLYILIFGADGSAQQAGLVDPAGTTRILNDYVANNSTWRMVVGTYSGSGNVGFTGTFVGAQTAAFFRDVALGTVGTPWKRSSTVFTLTCSALTRSDPGSEIITLGGDRAINASAGEQGYTSLANASVLGTYLADQTLSAGARICRTWWGVQSSAESGDATWTLNDSSGNGFGIQIELVPVAAPAPDFSAITLWDGAAEQAVSSIEVWDGANANTASAVEVMLPGYASVNEMLAQDTFWIAHRGGSANWAEMSLQAYTQSVHHPCPALEVSVARTSDGVYFGMHDQTMQRTSGVNINPTTLTWAQVQAYNIQVPAGKPGVPQPYMRLEELLAVYGQTHVIFLDPKYIYIDSVPQRTELLELALSYVPAERLVGKYYFTATGWATLCASYGVKTWGYLYEADLANLDTYQGPWDILGLNYDAAQATWDTVLAKGKKVIGHVCPNITAANTALSKGADGIMMQDVENVPAITITPLPTSTPEHTVFDTIPAATAFYNDGGDIELGGAFYRYGSGAGYYPNMRILGGRIAVPPDFSSQGVTGNVTLRVYTNAVYNLPNNGSSVTGFGTLVGTKSVPVAGMVDGEWFEIRLDSPVDMPNGLVVITYHFDSAPGDYFYVASWRADPNAVLAADGTKLAWAESTPGGFIVGGVFVIGGAYSMIGSSTASYGVDIIVDEGAA